MFTDVEGFTSLSEKLDPEDIHEILQEASVIGRDFFLRNIKKDIGD